MSVPNEFCAVDNGPCSGQCREQSRLVEKYKVFNKKTKEMEVHDRMCPALMTMSDLPPEQQRKYEEQKKQQLCNSSDEEL